MTETTHETPEMEMQVLTAQGGTAYLLPRALVEAARLTPEEAAAFSEAEARGDVQGYLSSAPSALPPGALNMFNTMLTAIASFRGFNPLANSTGGAPSATLTGPTTTSSSTGWTPYSANWGFR